MGRRSPSTPVVPFNNRIDNQIALAGDLGALILRSDGDLRRVRETISAALRAFGVPGTDVDVSPLGIRIATGGRTMYTRRIGAVSRNLQRLSAANALSRAIAQGMSDRDVREALIRIEAMTDRYPQWLVTLAGAAAAAGIAVLVSGAVAFFLPVLLVAYVVEVALLVLGRLGLPRWAEGMCAGAVAASVALVLRRCGLALDPGMVVTGGLVPLVPGILSATVPADLLSGAPASAAVRAAETVGTAAALASGVALVLSAHRFLGGPL